MAVTTCRRHVGNPDVRHVVVGVSGCATLALSGAQMAFDTRAPAGIWMVFFEPSAAESSGCPSCCAASSRARLALESMRRHQFVKRLAKVFIATGPSAISSRNHFLSGLRLASVTLSCRGARTSSASSFGGCDVALLFQHVVRQVVVACCRTGCADCPVIRREWIQASGMARDTRRAGGSSSSLLQGNERIRSIRAT